MVRRFHLLIPIWSSLILVTTSTDEMPSKVTWVGSLLTEKGKNETGRGSEGGRRSLTELLQLFGKIGTQTGFRRGNESLIRSQI